MTPDVIERETLISAPLERVWSLITDPEHVGRWFGDAGAEIDLRPGGTMLLRWTEYGEVRARVEEVEPPRRFAYRWGARNAGPGDELVEGNSTRVEFTLEPDGEQTRLRVVERGFAALSVDEAARTKHHGENTEGWASELGELAEYARKAAV
jgi:uncharacterized protein YndB with AHSA1/START domain